MSPTTIKLLSIDDKAKISDLDRKRYRNMGVFSQVAKSFAEAESLLKEESYDIIVLNFDYDKIDAAAIAHHFKTTNEFSHIPIVITTVQNKEKISRKLNNSVELIVEFPIPSQVFVERIRSLLDQKTRKNQRVSQKFSGKFTVNGNSFEAEVEDISSTGLLLGTKTKRDIGETIDIEFTIPNYKKPFKAIGEVVREIDLMNSEVDDINGIGVRFIEFKGDSQKRLNTFLAKKELTDSKISYYL